MFLKKTPKRFLWWEGYVEREKLGTFMTKFIEANSLSRTANIFVNLDFTDSKLLCFVSITTATPCSEKDTWIIRTFT